MDTQTRDTEESHGTGIEWTHHPGYRGVTWNPLVAVDEEGNRGWFCTHVSEGCRNCYAEKLNVEGVGDGFGTGHEYTYQNLSEITFEERNIDDPIRWRKPRCAFVNSMTDLFHEEVPRQIIDRTFAAMALGQSHRFLVLTKRPYEMRKYLSGREARLRVAEEMSRLIEPEHQISSDFVETRIREIRSYDKLWPPHNVWLGTSVENQDAADNRIPDLLAAPGFVRFVSVEPLIGPVDLTNVETIESNTGEEWHFNALSGSKDDGLYFPDAGADGEVRALDWVIAGGESGENARPPHPIWFERVRDQCRRAGVPFFFKQWGAWKPVTCIPEEWTDADQTTVRERPSEDSGVVQAMFFVGKDTGEDLLSGQRHEEIPKPEIYDKPSSM